MTASSHRRICVSVVVAMWFHLGATAETIDRIALSVGRTVITESQIIQEARVAAFLNGEEPDFSTSGRNKTIKRLIDQTLLRREMDFTRFEEAAVTEGRALLPQLTSRFPAEQDYRAALVKAHITEDEAVAHLTWQVTLLRFIQYRFQPGVQVVEADLKDFYDEQAQKWRDEGKPVLSFEEARAGLEPALVARYVDQALDRWLGEQRTQTDIIYKK